MVARLKGMRKAQEEENKEGDKKEGDKKEGEIKKEGEKRKKKNKGLKRKIRGEQLGYATRRVSWLEFFLVLFVSS